MQDYVIKIGHQPCLTHREDPDRIPETVIVSQQFFPACTENSIIPVTEKLDNSPQDKDCQQYPLSCRLQAIIRKQSDALQAEHEKFNAFDPHPLNQQVFPEPVGCDAAQEP